jgi:hypothetical protein
MGPTEQLTLSTASVRRHCSSRLRCIASLGLRLSHHPQLRRYTSQSRSMRPNTNSLVEPEKLPREQLGHDLQYTHNNKLSSDSVNCFVIFNCGYWMENNRWNKALLWRKTKTGYKQCRGENNIKLDLKWMGWEDMQWSHLTQDGVQRETLVNTVWNFEFYQTEAIELLSSQLVRRSMNNQLNFAFTLRVEQWLGTEGYIQSTEENIWT